MGKEKPASWSALELTAAASTRQIASSPPQHKTYLCWLSCNAADAWRTGLKKNRKTNRKPNTDIYILYKPPITQKYEKTANLSLNSVFPQIISSYEPAGPTGNGKTPTSSWTFNSFPHPIGYPDWNEKDGINHAKCKSAGRQPRVREQFIP